MYCVGVMQKLCSAYNDLSMTSLQPRFFFLKKSNVV